MPVVTRFHLFTVLAAWTALPLHSHPDMPQHSQWRRQYTPGPHL